MVWPFASRPARQPDVAASAEPRLPAYALTVELHRPFHAALRDVRSALEAEELQLWQEQDLTALLGHGQPQVVLGFCAPRVLELALQLDPELCALLPLQGSVREIAPGQVRVALQDPMGSVALCRSTEWQGLCKFRYGRLRRVVDRLMLGPPGI